MSGWGLPYHHYKRSEKCLSFAVRWAMLGKFKTGILLSADLWASRHIYSRRSRCRFSLPPLGKGVVSRKAVFSYRSLPHWGRGTAQRRSGALVNDALETIFLPLFHTVSPIHSAPSGHLLPWEGGSVHASPFPWKGLPSAARRGWLPFLAAKPPPLCLPPWERRCVEKSGILVSQPSPLGKGDRVSGARVLS